MNHPALFRFTEKGKADRVYLAVLLPLIPLLASYGLYRDHLRHLAVGIILLYIPVGRLPQLLFQHTMTFRPLYRWAIVLTLSTSLLLLMAASIHKHQWKNLIADRMTGRFSVFITPGGRFGKDVHDGSEWLRRHVPKGAAVCTGGMFDHAVIFYTDFSFRYGCRRIPRYHLITELISSDGDKSKKISQKGKIVEIETSVKFRSAIPFYRKQLAVIYEKDLQEYLKQLCNRKYWIMNFDKEKLDFPGVLYYLARLTRKVYDKNGVTVFETLPEKKNCFKSLEKRTFSASARTIQDLEWLKQTYPEEYYSYAAVFTANGINISNMN